MRSYLQHGRRHLPGGSDPIPGLTLGGGGTPSVATFYQGLSGSGDDDLTVAAGDTQTVTFAHSKLPSDGSVSAQGAFGLIPINIDCIVYEAFYTVWEEGDYARAGIIGTNSRIITADFYQSGAIVSGAQPASFGTRQTVYARQNAYVSGDTVHAYVTNDDSASRAVTSAWLVLYLWPATGYDGSIPGWPQ
jgi:hypothetical protein